MLSREIEIERRPVQVTEEYLGTYEAEALALSIGNEEVVAQPVGTLLIGSSGRVDLSGPRKTLRIMLIEKGGPTLRINISGSDGPIETSTRQCLVSGRQSSSGTPSVRMMWIAGIMCPVPEVF